MTLYGFFQGTHAYINWLAFVLLTACALRSIIALYGGYDYAKFDQWASVVLLLTVYCLLLSGIILYVAFSPLTKLALIDIRAAMNDPELRFWAIEHLLVMIFSIGAVQTGFSIARKAEDSPVKFRFQAIFYGVALLLMIIAIPWSRI